MTQRPSIEDWIEVTPPPKPYLHVLRRSFRRGLHVLILVSEADGQLQVLSSVDHGTLRATCTPEGAAPNPEELARLIAKTCERWNGPAAAATPASDKRQRRYFYTKPTGGISDPVSRETLFQLVTQGALDWESQIWDEIDAVGSSGQWRPIMESMGFPHCGALSTD